MVRSERFQYLADNFVWVWLGLAAILAGITFLIDPGGTVAHTPLAQLVNPYDYVWNVAYILAGSTIVVGILGRKPDVEALGLMLFAGALSMYTFALFLLASAGAIGIFAYPALVIAAVLRVVVMLLRAREASAGRPSQPPPSQGPVLSSVAVAPLAALVLAGTGIDPVVIVGLIGVLFGGGGIAAYRLIRPQRDSLRADFADKLTSAADRIIERQQAQITSLEIRVQQLEAKLLHQTETDQKLAAAEAARDGAEAAVERLSHRVEELVGILAGAGLRVAPEDMMRRPPTA